MTLIDLKTKKPLNFERYGTPNSKIPKTQKDTGIRIKWLTEFSEVLTNEIEEATEVVENIEHSGQYYKGDKKIIGVLVHSGDEPCVFAGWYGDTHGGCWNLYGDQPKNSQQAYFLGGAGTIFIGLF